MISEADEGCGPFEDTIIIAGGLAPLRTLELVNSKSIPPFPRQPKKTPAAKKRTAVMKLAPLGLLITIFTQGIFALPTAEPLDAMVRKTHLFGSVVRSIHVLATLIFFT